MTATMLLDALRTKGVHLTVKGEHITVDAPKGVLTTDLRQAIRTQKTALLALLTASTPQAASAPLSPTYPCVVCGRTQQRWNDHGIWRCMACWPPGRMEQAARRIDGIEV